MSDDDKARAEAERRYPESLDPNASSLTYPHVALQAMRASAFTAGAAWGREQDAQPSVEDVTLVEREREEYGEAWDALVPEVGRTVGWVVTSTIDAILAEFDVAPRGVPSVEDVARTLFTSRIAQGDYPEGTGAWETVPEDWREACRADARAVLALFEKGERR